MQSSDFRSSVGSQHERLLRVEQTLAEHERRIKGLENRWQSIDRRLNDIRRIVIVSVSASGIVIEILRIWQTGKF